MNILADMNLRHMECGGGMLDGDLEILRTSDDVAATSLFCVRPRSRTLNLSGGSPPTTGQGWHGSEEYVKTCARNHRRRVDGLTCGSIIALGTG
jgi:hypothetical protein